ncbi:hypothetical protein ACHQM5_015131 [Ranunculus cassubicifolius]
MADERYRQILVDVFGESSSEDDEKDEFSLNWEEIKEIKGLWLCRNFLSSKDQSSLLIAIKKEGWFTEASNNQAMAFGNLPGWATELSTSIHKAVCLSEHVGRSPMPSSLLWREPFFDQLIVNLYQPGEGICAHVDLMRFEDGIAVVSLESSCVMNFSQVDAEASNVGKGDKDIPVYLTPGSLIVMSGEARYHWKHEINRKPGFQVWEGKEIDQGKRTSVTLRKLCPSL